MRATAAGRGAGRGAEFIDWLVPERTRVRRLAHDAHLRVAQRLAAHGDKRGARAVAETPGSATTGCEEMHGLLMSWLNGDRRSALRGVTGGARGWRTGAPSESMAALAERCAGQCRARGARRPARLTAATSFIGRADEPRPSCARCSPIRVPAAHAPRHGGRPARRGLASALADMGTETRFPTACTWSRSTRSARRALRADAGAARADCSPRARPSPLDLVASFLGDRSALLLLDNLEHLLGDDPTDTRSIPGQVATLLRSTGARLKVIATSREPLRLQEEWVYELGGLAHPRGVADAEGAQDFAAVQFFAQRARQAYVGFSLAAELPNVIKVCELLEGLPLGLELAASWVRNVPCAEIASGLVASAQELRNRHANRAARHDSLGAVVAYSWDRLPLGAARRRCRASRCCAARSRARPRNSSRTRACARSPR
jgi:hypothetical protein